MQHQERKKNITPEQINHKNEIRKKKCVKVICLDKKKNQKTDSKFKNKKS